MGKKIAKQCRMMWRQDAAEGGKEENDAARTRCG